MPRENLSVLDSVAIVVGVVVGVGIFKTPSIVASVSESGTILILFWLLGGLVSLIGALCYAELSSTYPNAGGDYHFLRMSFGKVIAFLFAWSRMTVIQSGSIAMVAFLIGDYASELFNFGPFSNFIYAISTVILLSFINILGIKQGKFTQRGLVAIIMIGLLAIISLLVFFSPESTAYSYTPTTIPSKTALGTAMIFVLLTYGGWNEVSFISSEVRSKQKNIIKVLLISIALITLIYLLINLALLKSLGLTGMAASNTVFIDLAKNILGTTGAKVITALILIAALSTINATIITGSRTNYALGKDQKILGFLGNWQENRGTPVNALIAQCVIALALIFVGMGSRDGFVMMVEYTAPVFWFFFLMVGISLFVLRAKNPTLKRPFSVPLYPITPLIFCLVCTYMLYSSIIYTGMGGLVGVVVLLIGIPILLLKKIKNVK